MFNETYNNNDGESFQFVLEVYQISPEIFNIVPLCSHKQHTNKKL